MSAFSSITFLAKDVPQDLDTVNIQLKFYHGFQFAGFYAAKTKGYFEDEGIYVNLIEGSTRTDVIQTVLTNKAQYGVTGTALMTARIKGEPVVMLKAIYQHSPLTLVSLKETNLVKPSDFIGKTIMIGGGYSATEIKAAFQQAGVDVNKIIFAQHTWNYDDVISGKVDAATAYIIDQPYLFKEKGYDINLFEPIKYGVDFYGDALFTSEKEVEENPERVEKIIRASIKGWKYALDNNHEMANYILTLPSVIFRNKTSKSILYQAKISQKYLLSNIVEFGHINPDRIKKITKTYENLGLASKTYSLENFIYNPNISSGISLRYFFLAVAIAIAIVLFSLWIILRLRYGLKNKSDNLEAESSEKEQTKKLLEQNEITNKAMLDASPDLMFRVSSKGIYLAANIPVGSDLGIVRHELIGKNITEIMPKNVSPLAQALITKSLKTEELQFLEYTMPHNNVNSEFEARIVPAGENDVLVIVRDITERKEKENELRKSEEQYRTLFDNANDAIFIINKKGIRNCNQKALEMLSCERDQIITKSPSFFVPRYQPDKQLSIEKIKVTLTKCLGGTPQRFEWRFLRFDRTEFDAEVSLTKLETSTQEYLIAIVRDVSKSKLKTKALKESEEKFSKIFHSSPDSIVLTTVEDSRIVDCNNSFLEISGFSKEEIIGKTPLELNLWENGSDRDEFKTILAEKNTIQSIRYNFRKKDGEIINCLVSTEIVKINNEDIILGTYRDITELVKKDNLLKETLLKFSKVFELSPIAMGIYHLDDGKIVEINKEFERIMGYAKDEVIGKTTKQLKLWAKPSERKEYVDTVKQNGFVKDLPISFRRKNGDAFLSLFSSELIKLNNQDFVITNFIDITTIKEKENDLQNSLAQVKLLTAKLEEENILLKQEINTNYNIGNIITNSPLVRKELKKIQQVASTTSNVLILGETGTGKELFSRTIHRLSNRSDKPLIKINCAALPANLIESELFGHEKGAFTGAVKKHIGRFELANNATIFLDEIGELPLEIQSKLLRVLQEGEFERVGSSITKTTDARVIAASNRDLQKMTEQGTFREDLFYRLNVFPITTTPLRDRKEDIEPLVNNFIKQISTRLGKKIDSVEKHSFNLLVEYSFPGNIRELENIIERAVITSNNSVLVIDLPSKRKKNLLLNNTVLEKDMIVEALNSSDWKIEGSKGAANKIGIPPSTLRDKIKKYNLINPS